MKKIIIALAIALPLAGCANNASNNGKAANESTEASIEAPAGQVVGAFTEPREITSEELEMFKKATAGYAELQLVPQTVRTQVVNGINYKFFCDGKDGYNLTRSEVTIYKPINGEPKVTTIEMK